MENAFTDRQDHLLSASVELPGVGSEDSENNTNDNSTERPDHHHVVSVLLGSGDATEFDGNGSVLKEDPPPQLQQFISKKLWTRFRGHMAGVNIRTTFRQYGVTSGRVGSSSDSNCIPKNLSTSLCGILSRYLHPCWVFFWVLHIIDTRDHRVGHPYIFIAYMVLLILLILQSVYDKCYGGPKFASEQYQHIVNKMHPTFEAIGFHTELGSFREQSLCRQRYYVAFYRMDENNAPFVVDSGNANNQDEDEDAMAEKVGHFCAAYWSPLEGTWIRTAEHVPEGHMYSTMRQLGEMTDGHSCCMFMVQPSSLPSLTWVFERRASTRYNSIPTDTIHWERTFKTNMFWGLYHKTVVSCHETKYHDGQGTFINMMEYVPFELGLSPYLTSHVQNALQRGTHVVPLLPANHQADVENHQSSSISNQCPNNSSDDGSGGVWYYLHGDNGVLRVTATMIQKFEYSFVEDMPSHDDILFHMALENTDKGDCMVWTFERALTLD